jgi:phage terminase small subunit
MARQAHELLPIDQAEVEDGPAMKALPTDRHRAFVRALYQVKPGHGAQVKAARMAGWGSPTSTPKTMSVIASRLAHDPRVQAALYEEDQKRIRATAPRAISALAALVENPKHRDHARGIAMVLDRVHPAETAHKLTVEHAGEVKLSAPEMARMVERIMELAARAKVAPMIDVTPEKATS